MQEEERQKRLALEERDRNYQTLMSVLMREPLIANQEEIECPICFDTIPIGEGVVLRECLHSFCRYVAGGNLSRSSMLGLNPFGNPQDIFLLW